MKKKMALVLFCLILFAFSGMFSLIVNASSHFFYVDDGGITRMITYNTDETELNPICAYPELYVGDGTYLYNGIEYGYEICYIYEEEIVEIDINGNAFYYDDYVMMEWTYDFDETFDYAYGDFSGGYYDSYEYITQQYYLFEYLPTVSTNEGDFYIYRSQVLKYDPETYSQINFLMEVYSLYLSDYIDEQVDLANASVNSLIAMIPGISNDDIEGIKFDIMELVDMGGTKAIELYYEDTPKEGLVSLVLTIYELAKIMVENGEGTTETVVTSLLNNEVTEVTSAYSDKFARSIFFMIFGKFCPGGGFFGELAYILSSIKDYRDSAEYYTIIRENIESIKTMFSLAGNRIGENIRIDYVADRHKVILPEEVGGFTNEDYVNFFEQDRTSALLFSYADNDVFSKYMYSNNNLDIPTEGNLKVYKSNGLAESLDVVITGSLDDNPISIFEVDVYDRYIVSVSYDEVQESTPFRSKYYSFVVESDTPLLSFNPISSISAVSLGVDFTFTNISNYDSTEVVIIDVATSNTIFDRRYTNINIQDGFFGLQEGKTYNVRIFVKYYSDITESFRYYKCYDVNIIINDEVSISKLASTYNSIRFKVIHTQPEFFVSDEIKIYRGSTLIATYYSSNTEFIRTVDNLSVGTTYKISVKSLYLNFDDMTYFYDYENYYITTDTSDPRIIRLMSF